MSEYGIQEKGKLMEVGVRRREKSGENGVLKNRRNGEKGRTMWEGRRDKVWKKLKNERKGERTDLEGEEGTQERRWLSN